MSANAVQVGGDHYKASDNQPWDLISRHGIGFLEGSVIKYVSRWRGKNGREDLEKAHHFLMKIEEVEQEGYTPAGDCGPRVLNDYFLANEITDFRERIVISIMATRWSPNQLNHAALLLGSLIETARDGEAQES